MTRQFRSQFQPFSAFFWMRFIVTRRAQRPAIAHHIPELRILIRMLDVMRHRCFCSSAIPRALLAKVSGFLQHLLTPSLMSRIMVIYGRHNTQTPPSSCNANASPAALARHSSYLDASGLLVKTKERQCRNTAALLLVIPIQPWRRYHIITDPLPQEYQFSSRTISRRIPFEP